MGKETLTLQTPCFRYDGAEFFAQLAVELGHGDDRLVRCPVRGGLYSLTPEEHVRQAFVWFLIAGASNAGRWKPRLRLEVKQRSIDLAAFLATSSADQRCVFNIPVLLIETKRPEVELTENVGEQLKTYMIRERCRSGLMFNGQDASWISVQGEFTQGCWTEERLFDLREAEDRLEQATQEATKIAADYKEASTLAAEGEFDSLLRLISLIGNDSRPTLTLSIRVRGNLSAVQAFGIRKSDADHVSFRARGVVSRNRQVLTRHEFHSLIAVRPC